MGVCHELILHMGWLRWSVRSGGVGCCWHSKTNVMGPFSGADCGKGFGKVCTHFSEQEKGMHGSHSLWIVMKYLVCMLSASWQIMMY